MGTRAKVAVITYIPKSDNSLLIRFKDMFCNESVAGDQFQANAPAQTFTKRMVDTGGSVHIRVT